jgi:hypothetical protein
MTHFVGLDNYLPGPPAESGLDHEATVHDVGSAADGMLQHMAQIDLGESAVLHPFFDVRCQLEFPLPPVRKVHGKGSFLEVFSTQCLDWDRGGDGQRADPRL